MVLLFLGVILGAGLMWIWSAAGRKSAPVDLAAMPDSAVALRPGPWGNLEVLPIFIEPPDEYLATGLIEKVDHRWAFRGFTSEQLLSLFKSAGLDSAQLAELTNTAKWQSGDGGIYVDPSKDLILSLSTESRKQIYEPMYRDRQSLYGRVGQTYPADRFDSYFANSGLSPETVELVRKLSFPYGKLLVFCDVQLVLETLPTSADKTRLIKTLLRKSTLVLRLHITPDSNINALEHYWIRAGWGLDLRPMLESLAALPQGARLDLVELLPPIPSANIYTYPFPSMKPEDQQKDCRWTALNFFRDVPDDRFIDSEYDRKVLLSDYYPALSDARYGDIIALTRPNGETIHVAVYIAADIVYTKNDGNFREPFILMTYADMLDHFAALIPENETLKVQIFRNKYY